MEQSCQQPLCKSIFKNGTSETSVQSVTDAWVNMINQIQKIQSVNDEQCNASEIK